MDLPIENRSNTMRALYKIAYDNWRNRFEMTKQKHTLGYLCGLAGIGKSTILSVLKQTMMTMAKQVIDVTVVFSNVGEG